MRKERGVEIKFFRTADGNLPSREDDGLVIFDSEEKFLLRFIFFYRATIHP